MSLAKAIAENDPAAAVEAIMKLYVVRKRVEMERTGTPREEMNERWRYMRTWANLVKQVAKESETRSEMREKLQPVFDDAYPDLFEGRGPIWPTLADAEPLCRDCNEHGLRWGRMRRGDHVDVVAVVVCGCDYGAKRREALKARPKRKRGRTDDF